MLGGITRALDARRARKAGREAAGSSSFDRTHPRGRDGRFVDVPDAPKPAGRETKGAAALKTRGVTGEDRIVVLSGRVRKYQGFATVDDFVASHPRGPAYARRVLAADHKAGRIGFGEAAAPRPIATMETPITVLSSRVRKYQGHATVGDFIAAHPKGRLYGLRVVTADVKAGRIRLEIGAPPGAGRTGAARRDLSRDEFVAVPDVLSSGLVRDEAQLRSVSAALLAGVPDDQPMRVVWASTPGGIKMIATGRDPDVQVTRTFTRAGDGWNVNHDTFTLPRRYQGKGGARRMLRASVEAYGEIGVRRIGVHANISVGGYAWARLGFAPTEKSAALTRAIFADAVAAHPRSHAAQGLRRVLATASDEDLMHEVARMTGPTGKPLGKAVLMGADWYGYVDLTNDAQRRRLAANLGDR